MKIKTTLRNIASQLNIDDFETPCEYDLSDLGIKINTPSGYKDMTNFVVKNAVDTHYILPSGLKTTSVHKTLVNNEWIKSKDRKDSIKVDQRMQVVDVSVPDGECYLAGNEVNHNTTPGGMAIPFHSSVRIKLGAGSQILNKDKEPIGINVSAKTIKNKVSAPFRKCDFEIHFGIGIKEHEQVFDLLRKHGTEVIDGNTIQVGGTGAWKTLHVWDKEGEEILEKKFYKSEFQSIMKHPEYGPYIDTLLERVMIRKNNTDDPDIDPESYSEIEEVAKQVIDIHEEAFEHLS